MMLHLLARVTDVEFNDYPGTVNPAGSECLWVVSSMEAK